MKHRRRTRLTVYSAFAIFLVYMVLNFVYYEFLPETVENIAQFQQYVHPHNSFIKGMKFGLNSNSYSLALKLMSQLENGEKVETFSMDSLSEAMTPVTAISSDHFQELMKHFGKFHRFVPNKRLIVYDLGLDQKDISTLRRVDFIEYRIFDFSAYPKHVRNLHTYAWKPLIIQQVLAERGGVMWVDSSVKIMKPYTNVLQQMVNTSCGFLYYLVPAGHSIASATHPGMFKYLPMRNFKEMKLKMPQAGGILIFNTLKIRQLIFKWAILCSLLKDCIATQGSRFYCNPKYLADDRIGGCHRYDQSMFAILVTNAFDSQTAKYTIPKKLKFAVVDRLDQPLYRQVLFFLKSWFT